jgi:hypothetical protein
VYKKFRIINQRCIPISGRDNLLVCSLLILTDSGKTPVKQQWESGDFDYSKTDRSAIAVLSQQIWNLSKSTTNRSEWITIQGKQKY